MIPRRGARWRIRAGDVPELARVRYRGVTPVSGPDRDEAYQGSAIFPSGVSPYRVRCCPNLIRQHPRPVSECRLLVTGLGGASTQSYRRIKVIIGDQDRGHVPDGLDHARFARAFSQRESLVRLPHVHQDACSAYRCVYMTALG